MRREGDQGGTGEETRVKEGNISLFKNSVFNLERYLKLFVLARLSHEISDS